MGRKPSVLESCKVMQKLNWTEALAWGICLILNNFWWFRPIVNSFGPPKKKILWIQFCSSVCLSLTQSKALRIFFSFLIPKGKRSCEFSPFGLSTCTLILHQKWQNNLRIFLIFCKKSTVWKDVIIFEENNVPFPNLMQIGAQNPKTILMSFMVLCTVMEGNSGLVSTACQTKYLFSINFGNCRQKNLESSSVQRLQQYRKVTITLYFRHHCWIPSCKALSGDWTGLFFWGANQFQTLSGFLNTENVKILPYKVPKY